METLLHDVAAQLLNHGYKLVTAESCTGGGVAYHLTELAGSSAWFERGFITYSNAAKIQALGVAPTLLDRYGAVSEPTARAMAEGALRHSAAQISLAITGIAGPGGGTAAKPVGTICFGWAGTHFATQTDSQLLRGDRHAIRQQAISFALARLLTLLTP